MDYPPSWVCYNYCINKPTLSGGLLRLVFTGHFLFSQNFQNFRFGGKWNTFRWFIPLENSQKKWKTKKVGPFSRLEFPNGISCSIYVSRSLYQFQVHRRAPRRTGVYDQMEQLFTNRKFHFCSHRNFRVFFLNGKRLPLMESES